jgi:hypothetical protein
MRTVLPNNLHFERNFLLAAVQLQQLSHAAILNEETNYSINLDGMDFINLKNFFTPIVPK